MKISTQSSFLAYELDPVEQLAGYTFNAAQRAVIQNMISAAAEDFLLVGLQEDGTELVMSLDEKLRLAGLRGEVRALRHLLLTADVLKEEMESKQAEQNNPSDTSL